jgi:hypothetical protein
MLAIGAMPFSFAETEPVDDTFELSEVVVTGTNAQTTTVLGETEFFP